MAHPIEGLKGLASVVSNPDVRNSIGAAANSLQAGIDRMTLAMETGGDEQAIQLGRDIGLLVYTVGSIVTGDGRCCESWRFSGQDRH